MKRSKGVKALRSCRSSERGRTHAPEYRSILNPASDGGNFLVGWDSLPLVGPRGVGTKPIRPGSRQIENIDTIERA
ncbi:MAG: hypothetical protein JOZ19_10775 [Rubrobacter sp.]|nr:hypothetical protein [Rubrobacter sp.]